MDISLKEWLQYISGGQEFRLDNYAEAELPMGKFCGQKRTGSQFG